MTGIVLVRVNCTSRAEAEAIAAAALEQRLAAAANIHAPIDSRYRWQGETRSAAEVPLELKTQARHFDALAALIAGLHAYHTPSILALPVTAGHAPYLDWIAAETGPKP